MADNIKSIRIKNVRGLKDLKIELGMIPNKPSILVAPNGSGKSSFAMAFKSLKRDGLSVPEEEIFDNNSENIPELHIELENGNIYEATPERNRIKEFCSVYVINNENKAQASIRNIRGMRVAKAKMAVEPIVLVNKVVREPEIRNTFIEDYSLQEIVRGAVPSISDILRDNIYISNFQTEDLDRGIIKQIKQIESFLERLKTYSGSKKQIWETIERNDLSTLQVLPILSSRINSIKNVVPYASEVQLYLRAIQIVILYQKNKSAFKGKIAYAKFQMEYDNYEELFSFLKKTWKGIKPKIEGDKVIVEIPDTGRISNGERDIIVFLANLQKAKKELKGEYNILIIDEVFDYLDDANLVSAQYYIADFISRMKEEGKNIFPIILTHINPDYFKTFAFKKSKMKVYYLKKFSAPKASDNMLKLLRKRNEKKDKDLISKYMLHYHYNYDEAKHDLEELLKDDHDIQSWSNVTKFKEYCKEETNKYINGDSTEYDAIAVCVWLRESIEKYLYSKMPEDKKESFISEHGTESKIDFAETNGIDTPDIFSMLGMIYNDNLHIGNNQDKDLRQTLYSRLQNNTIKNMVAKVIEYYDK